MCGLKQRQTAQMCNTHESPHAGATREPLSVKREVQALIFKKLGKIIILPSFLSRKAGWAPNAPIRQKIAESCRLSAIHCMVVRYYISCTAQHGTLHQLNDGEYRLHRINRLTHSFRSIPLKRKTRYFGDERFLT